MKIKSNILLGVLILLCGFWSQLVAQTRTVIPLQPNQQEVLLNYNDSSKVSVWLPLTGIKGIYFNGGVVGIGTEKPSEKLLLHVAGIAGVDELVINEQYSLPKEKGKPDQFLNGEGKWAIPSSMVGGESYWHPVSLGTGIYFNGGNVGIGTTAPGANLQVQGNMKLGNNIGNVGANAFAGGEESVASGTNSFAFGDESKATNNGAFAVGLRAEASGTNSIAIGRASKANYENAFALGYVAEAIAINSIVIGRHARATESNAYIVGSGAGLSTQMLVNNIENSLIMGFNSNLPTFFVSSSAGAGTTGNIGIGNMTDPQVKLHILSDIGEAAVLKLEHRTTGIDRYAQLFLGNHSIKAGNYNDMVFTTPATNRDFVFENGNVGIGVSNPKAKLEVAGDIDFSGDLYSNGQLFTGSNWTVNGENIYRSTGNVGIGFDQPTTSLGVLGTISVGYHVPVPNDQNNVLVEGKVGIGTFAPEAPLDVAGKIRSESLQLTQGFYPGYLLTSDDQGHAIWTNPETILNIGPWQRQGNNVFVTGYDRVGIGTDQPTESLQINGNMMLSNNGNIKGNRTSWQPFKIFAGNDESEPYIALYGNSQNTGSIKLYSFGTGGQIEFHNENMKVMSIRADNNVYFGNPDYSTNLFVNGEITANQVRVNTSFWWDKVLKPDYELMPLAELQTFITQNSHLPDIPKETEVIEQGIDLGEMNGLLLKKIEELSLYLLEQDRKINTLQEELQQIKNAVHNN